MGNLISSCCKKKDDDDNWDKGINNNADKINDIGDKYCKGSIAIKINNTASSNDNQNLLGTSGIYKTQFDTDPMKQYKIVSEISENLKSVCLIDNSSQIRLMKITPKKYKTQNKNDPFLVEAQKLQILDHPNIFKIFNIYIFNDNYYIIFENCEKDNLVEKVKTGEWSPNEAEIKTFMNYLFNSIVHLHEKNIFNIELKLKVLSINTIVIKSSKKILKKLSKVKKKNAKKIIIE
jgi:hypothetical protein